jgi:hypothetical protein
MMGVKQGGAQLSGDIKAEFDKILKERPKYGVKASLTVQFQTLGYFRRIDSIVDEFFASFNPIYENSRKLDFNKMSLGEQIAFCEYFLHFDR